VAQIVMFCGGPHFTLDAHPIDGAHNTPLNQGRCYAPPVKFHFSRNRDCKGEACGNSFYSLAWAAVLATRMRSRYPLNSAGLKSFVSSRTDALKVRRRFSNCSSLV